MVNSGNSGTTKDIGHYLLHNSPHLDLWTTPLVSGNGLSCQSASSIYHLTVNNLTCRFIQTRITAVHQGHTHLKLPPSSGPSPTHPSIPGWNKAYAVLPT